ncbi:MAG: hypothetical protein ACLPUO_11315 [Streptosporangiaceae bacterium]
MSEPQFEPHEGGVKVVFDVRADEAGEIARTVAAAGFEVSRYYGPGRQPRRGGSAPGWIRLGAANGRCGSSPRPSTTPLSPRLTPSAVRPDSAAPG